MSHGVCAARNILTNRFMDQIDGIVIQLVNESERQWTMLTDGTFGFEESFISFKDRRIMKILLI